MKQVKVNAGENPEPLDRLTRLADAARKAIEADPEYRAGDRLIISVADEAAGGFFTCGYGEDQDSADAGIITDLVEHIEAIMSNRAGGACVHLIPVQLVPLQGPLHGPS